LALGSAPARRRASAPIAKLLTAWKNVHELVGIASIKKPLSDDSTNKINSISQIKEMTEEIIIPLDAAEYIR
jgi:hypothetical protein